MPGGRVRLRQLGAQRKRLRPGEAVQQLELRRGERQPAVLVLAEEGHEPPAERLEVRRRGGAATDERPRAPRGADPTGQHDLGGRGLLVLFVRVPGDPLAQVRQPRLLEQARGQLEHPFDVGLAGARAHNARPGPASQQEVERVGEDRLPRAGLAGDGREPLTGPQLGPLDQQEVLDAQLEEHGSGLPAGPDGAVRMSRAENAPVGVQ